VRFTSVQFSQVVLYARLHLRSIVILIFVCVLSLTHLPLTYITLHYIKIFSRGLSNKLQGP